MKVFETKPGPDRTRGKFLPGASTRRRWKHFVEGVHRTMVDVLLVVGVASTAGPYIVHEVVTAYFQIKGILAGTLA